MQKQKEKLHEKSKNTDVDKKEEGMGNMENEIKSNIELELTTKIFSANDKKLEKENYSLHEWKVDKIYFYPKDSKILESIKEYKSSLSKQNHKVEELPTKVYDIQSNKVLNKAGELTSFYAILSYTWGGKAEERNLANFSEKLKSITNKVSPSFEKTFLKSTIVCKIPTLDINYLWIDQLCIDQTDTSKDGEVSQEKKRMNKYYSNSAATLVAIHKKVNWQNNLSDEENAKSVIKLIADSEWFSRSWTFQEGLLSQRTIFMFDDCLVDGSFLAQVWVGDLSSGVRCATPLGWTYCADGYNSTDKLFVSLLQALEGVEGRRHTESVDGIYSIVGLLSYGEKIKSNYKDVCSQCELEANQKVMRSREMWQLMQKIGEKEKNIRELRQSWLGPERIQRIPQEYRRLLHEINYEKNLTRSDKQEMTLEIQELWQEMTWKRGTRGSLGAIGMLLQPQRGNVREFRGMSAQPRGNIGGFGGMLLQPRQGQQGMAKGKKSTPQENQNLLNKIRQERGGLVGLKNSAKVRRQQSVELQIKEANCSHEKYGSEDLRKTLNDVLSVALENESSNEIEKYCDENWSRQIIERLENSLSLNQTNTLQGHSSVEVDKLSEQFSQIQIPPKK